MPRSRRSPGATVAAIAFVGLAAAGCTAALGVDDFDADGCPARGERACSGKTLQICADNGEWRDERECTKACSDGACVADCTAGQKRCAGDFPQECGPGGQWSLPKASCPPEKPCSGGVCGAVCSPGDVRCDGDKAQACGADGQWHGDAACQKGCVLGACAACDPGEKKCENNTPRVCTSLGQWEIGTPCGKDEQCSDNGLCEPE